MLILGTYIIIAIVISALMVFTRHYFSVTNVANHDTILFGVSWIIATFSLLLAFTISNFYNRYVTTRDDLINEASNLEIIYELLTKIPNSETPREAIKKYLLKIISLENFKTQGHQEYYSMRLKIVNFLNDQITIHPFTNDILSRLSSDNHLEGLIREIKSGSYYINIICLLLVLVIIPLWFIYVDKYLQLFLVTCLMTMFLIIIYLMEILNDPFGKSPLQIKFESYRDVLNRINEISD